MFKLFKMIISSLLALLLGALFSWQLLNHYLDTPMDIPSPVSYQLSRGGSLNSVLAWLDKNSYLDYPRVISIYSRISGEGAHVQAGEYLFEENLTPRQLLVKLSGGDVIHYPVTFVEGWNLSQILKQLSTLPNLVHTDTADLNKFVQVLTEDYPSPEGLFFPDTYYFFSGMAETEILEQSFQRMQGILSENWKNRAEELPYQTPYDALIMASLIEKETGVAYERGEIAGVFVRRLQQGMRLQTDPTIIYGLGDSFDGNLRSRHLKDADNLYNTYRHHGLPPSPICMPGEESIYAALHPEPGTTLYFVAKGDGSHYFSSTLAEHNKAVQKYQINKRKKNYSSRPAQ